MGGNYSHTTRASGLVLTATIYNSDHQNHIDNATPDGLDDYSSNATQMQANADPGEVSSESLATSLAGELERLRFIIKEMHGGVQWYTSPATAFATLAANAFSGLQTTTDKLRVGTIVDRTGQVGIDHNGAAAFGMAIHNTDTGSNSQFSIKFTRGVGVVTVGSITTTDVDMSINCLTGTVTAGTVAAGTVNAGAVNIGGNAAIDVSTPGLTRQVVNTQDGTRATGTTVIPFDNTIPQNTEGFEVMTLAITPTSATNKLRIDIVVPFATDAANRVAAALFQDSTADALAVGRQFASGTPEPSLTFTHFMAAGTTSATTFKVRLGGASAGTVTFAGGNGGDQFGGTLAASITITEIQV